MRHLFNSSCDLLFELLASVVKLRLVAQVQKGSISTIYDVFVGLYNYSFKQ